MQAKQIKAKLTEWIKNTGRVLIYSFPVQLLWLNIKKNQLLLLCWFLLFVTVTGNLAQPLGIPYLFLDPEYLGSVNFMSFFLMGITLGIFTMAFNIACYILDGPEFKFVGLLTRPFTKFAINNGIIPLLFLVIYIINIINFQLGNEYTTILNITEKILGLLLGFTSMSLLFLIYFWFTNKDIFKMVAMTFEKSLRQFIITRVNIMQRLRNIKKTHHRVRHYLDEDLRWKEVPDTQGSQYDREAILKVFDQNHLNSLLLISLLFLVIILLGIFHDNPYFQIPAAASSILLLTMVIMAVGFLTYWVRGWVFTASILLFVLFNFLLETGIISGTYKAHGLAYDRQPAAYSLAALDTHNNRTHYRQDKQATLTMLNNWREKTSGRPDSLLTGQIKQQKPKMIFIAASGGGQRAALWTMNVLQHADSATSGRLMDHAQLITGASGGLIGAAYFRELVLRNKIAPKPENREKLVAKDPIYQQGDNIYDDSHLTRLGQDMLNPVMLSLVVNDIFIRYQNFQYNGYTYKKGRGLAFEKQLNQNTGFLLDKTIADYKSPEKEGMIPMMLMAPTIMNDGRKLYISPHHVSYMNHCSLQGGVPAIKKHQGLDYKRFFQNHEPSGLSFLTALRMSATFPYVTPSVTMPTIPAMKIMDAGMTDNFGVSDAVRFLYVFRNWIAKNTSGVVFVTIRDSEKREPITKETGTSLLERLSMPIGNFYQNWFNVQDMNNDDKLEYARSWFDGPIDEVTFEYSPGEELPSGNMETKDAGPQNQTGRASLSWRLTSREKTSIRQSIDKEKNQHALEKLERLLE